MNKTVLFVDDDIAVRTALGEYLNNSGFDVISAEGVGPAKTILDSHFDMIAVILSDVKMPDGSGVDLVDHVLENEWPIPVVLLTAYADLDLAIQGIRKHVYDLIEKPPDFDLLKQGMEKACRFSSLLRLEQRYTLELKAEINRKTDELNEERRRLAELAFELSRAEEHERRRIAAELHDNIGQTLIFSAMKLAYLNEFTLPPPCKDGLKDAMLSIESAVSAIRSLTTQISPPLLYDVGLAAALDSLAESFSSRYGLSISLAAAENLPEMKEELRSLLYQATRELLVNVVKHSEAETAMIEISNDRDNLMITVTDYGKGFSYSSLQNNGFGLFNIRQRLHRFGGTITIAPAQTTGAKVSLSIPINVTIQDPEI